MHWHAWPSQKFLEDLEEASDELMLSDEEVVRFTIGDCFVHLDKDSAETRLSEFADEYKNDVKTLEKEIGGIKEQLQVRPCTWERMCWLGLHNKCIMVKVFTSSWR